MTPSSAAWAASASSSTIPLSGGTPLGGEQALDAARRREGGGDAIDRVGRQRDDPARTQHRDRPPARPASRRRTTRARHERPRPALGRPAARRPGGRRALASGERQHQLFDHLRRAVVLERRGHVAADGADLGRRGRHRGAVARPRRSSRGRSTGRRSPGVAPSGTRSRRASQRIARPFDTPGATNSRNRGWEMVTSATPGELRRAAGGDARPATAARRRRGPS